MIIDSTNYKIGNQAMANVLLLYYHLLDEGGITNDQTIYLDPEEFNGFDFLDFEVNNSGVNHGIDETLVKQGAIIYLLCDLNDMIAEYDQDYGLQPITKKICSALKTHESIPIPEVKPLLNTVLVPESEFNCSAYNEILQNIYRKYVHDYFSKKL
ncbi:hypothetical protein FT643_22190 [Ketobacter sp. MCCC 1A13808]|uniref:hypothetical protein n=1 Tax=Ketobacter sp. MCCC 1A13808 TaxID=2602738 RepID=UPI0012EB2F27|nr:hypothetical protein [Ketobacter sp. MCCC 1A13808]MVF14850.1 hypothetical protein [Ketobacter sp. MCCC 1A13808]